MSTTALFVELLVVGLEALAWFALLVSSLFGFDWVLEVSKAFEKASVFMAVVVFGFAYLIGIIVDEVFDALISPWADRIRSSVREKGMPGMWDVQAYVFAHSEEEITQFGYMRSRLRIVRSSIFNVALIGIWALVCLWARAPVARILKINLTWFIGLASIFVVGLTIFVYWRITLSYWLGMCRLYENLKEKQLSGSGKQ